MATGSGLDAQLGTKTESAVGTQVVVSNFFPFNSAELTFMPSYINNPSITAGSRFLDVNQVGIARKAATGKIEVPIMNMGFGWWMKHILGSTANPIQIASTTAYKQTHTPGGLRGLSSPLRSASRNRARALCSREPIRAVRLPTGILRLKTTPFRFSI